MQERVFNYRLSRSRRIVENAFGICAARFRIFRRPITSQVKTVVLITKAVVALHNYLMFDRKFYGNDYCPAIFVDHERNHLFVTGE